MTSRYLKTWSGLTTRIIVRGLADGHTAMAVVRADHINFSQAYSSSVEEGATVISIPSLEVTRYELAIMDMADGSTAQLLTAILDVAEALPSPSPSSTGLLVDVTSTTPLIVDVSTTTVIVGGVIDEPWFEAIKGTALGLTDIAVQDGFNIRDQSGNGYILQYDSSSGGTVALATGIGTLIAGATQTSGFSAELPAWAGAIEGSELGISNMILMNGGQITARTADGLGANPIYWDGYSKSLYIGSGVSVLQSTAESTIGFTS